MDTYLLLFHLLRKNVFYRHEVESEQRRNALFLGRDITILGIICKIGLFGRWGGLNCGRGRKGSQYIINYSKNRSPKGLNRLFEHLLVSAGSSVGIYQCAVLFRCVTSLKINNNFSPIIYVLQYFASSTTSKYLRKRLHEFESSRHQ